MKLLTPQDQIAAASDDREEISARDLHTVFEKSLAHWKYGEKQDTKKMEFGLVSHAIILDHDKFSEQYIKDLDVEEYPDALVTTKDLQAWLSERGQPKSGAKGDLIKRVAQTAATSGEKVFIWDNLVLAHHEANKSKTIVSVDVFQKVQQMRSAIFSDESMANMLQNGLANHAIVGKLPICKAPNIVRPDIITAGGHLVNYVTSTDVHPEKFGRKCYDYGYLSKAALEWDMFTELYGEEPRGYLLLAQEKDSPFVWKPYYLTADHLNIGRAQRDYAQSLIENAIDTGKYSAYGSEPSPLELPDFIMKKYEEQ